MLAATNKNGQMSKQEIAKWQNRKQPNGKIKIPQTTEQKFHKLPNGFY